MGNPIVWADIPVTDLQRAMKFYSEVTARQVMIMPGAADVAVIVGPEGDGSAVSADLHVGGKPSHDGATVYLGAEGDIDGMVARVSGAGGKILNEKQFMGDMVGWVA